MSVWLCIRMDVQAIKDSFNVNDTYQMVSPPETDRSRNFYSILILKLYIETETDTDA